MHPKVVEDEALVLKKNIFGETSQALGQIRNTAWSRSVGNVNQAACSGFHQNCEIFPKTSGAFTALSHTRCLL